MVDMILQHVIPSALSAEKLGIKMPETATVERLNGCVASLKAKLHDLEHAAPTADASGSEDIAAAKGKATIARELRLETMEQVRDVCDAVEAVVPANMWTLATYKELLFLDASHGNTSLE